MSQLQQEDSLPGADGASSTHSGTVFLDTVTVELTTGTDLVARPYGHSVSGRHIMLSQAGTLWKATRSAREKKFYATIVAAATQNWEWLDAEEAHARHEAEATAAAAAAKDQDGQNRESGEGTRDVVDSPVVETVPSANHKAYTDAANAIVPFLPRYYGTRSVASLKVGSIGFTEEREEDAYSPGEYNMEAPRRLSAAACTSNSDLGNAVSGNSPLREDVGSLVVPEGSHGVSPHSQPPLNASRVVIHTDAVKQVMSQFAMEKKEAQADNQGEGKRHRPVTVKADEGCEAVDGPAPAAAVPTPPDGVDAHARNSPVKPTGGAAAATAASSLSCDDVVAVATAQIAEELARRLPPRHPDPARSTATSNTSPFLASRTSGGGAGGDPQQTAPPADRGLAKANEQKKEGRASANDEAHTSVNDNAGEEKVNGGGQTPGNGSVAAAAAAGDDGWVEMIVLQDVCYGFRYPCVLDVKMGVRQYGMHATPEKIREKEHKAVISTSKRYGIRLAGFKRWSATHQSFEVKSKHDLFTLSFEEVKEMVRYFLSSYQPACADDDNNAAGGQQGTGSEEQVAADRAERKVSVAATVRERLAEQLTRLLAAFKAHGVFRFYTSSLLIVYDAADPVPTVRAVMVDFAYTYEWKELQANGDPDAALTVDEGYITGIESLLEALRASA